MSIKQLLIATASALTLVAPTAQAQNTASTNTTYGEKPPYMFSAEPIHCSIYSASNNTATSTSTNYAKQPAAPIAPQIPKDAPNEFQNFNYSQQMTLTTFEKSRLSIGVAMPVLVVPSKDKSVHVYVNTNCKSDKAVTISTFQTVNSVSLQGIGIDYIFRESYASANGGGSATQNGYFTSSAHTGSRPTVVIAAPKGMKITANIEKPGDRKYYVAAAGNFVIDKSDDNAVFLQDVTRPLTKAPAKQLMLKQ